VVHGTAGGGNRARLTYEMERKEFARKVARSQNLPIARAQDQVDEVVDQIISQLRDAQTPQLDRLVAPSEEPVVAASRKAQAVAEVRAKASRIAKSRSGKP